jgi:iron complex outermembrane receptor protein
LNRLFHFAHVRSLLVTALLLNGVALGQAPRPATEPNSAVALKRLSLEELSQLEVTTVSKEPFPAFRTPAAVYVVTQEDIRRSGATSIPDVLRLIPGVHVAQIDSAKWAIGIRGFQGRLSKAVRVLIDGRSVYNPLFAGVYWEVQHVLLEDIERIEVVRGPGATIWGSNAVNGVINIITKSAMDTRGMLVSAASGNVEQGQLSWRYGAGTERLSARVYGTGFTRGPQLHVDGRNFDDWRMGQVGFRTDWVLNERDTITFQGDAYSTITGQKLVISQYSPPAAPAVEDNGFYSGQNLRGVWRRALKDGGEILLNAFFDRTDRTDLNYHELRDTYDVDLIHRIPLRRHDVIWGVGARLSPSEFTQTEETVDFIPHKQTYNIFSGFLQDEIALVPDRLALTFGSKFEHNTFSGFEVQPSGRLSWTPNRRHTVWGALTRAVRTPSRIEEGFRFTALLQPALPLYVRLIGDGEFSSEQLIGYEFGYRILIKQSALVSLSAFHNSYDDLLSVENRPPAVETEPPPQRLVLPLFFRNGVRAASSGVELLGVWDIGESWRLRGSYSFMGLNARNKTTSNDLSTVGQLEGDSPAHKAVVQSMFNLPKGFEADLQWRYVSSVPNQRVPAYSTADIRVGRRLGRELELAVVGQNLLQPSHLEYGGNPGPLVRIRRSAYVKLTWTR